ncbi:MAG: AEC family transporter [Coriobacteriia bacterium]|nr:AEC family transporter [Coriobacteriia bacterium]
MDAAELARIILSLVAIVGVGWLLRRFGVLAAEDARPINNIIIYAGLPAMIFRAVHNASLDRQLVGIAAVAWVCFIAVVALAWLACRALMLPRVVCGGFILAAALGNTGYIGYPISQAVLGDTGLVRAIFYDVFGTVAALLFVGLFIAERFGSSGERPINPIREALAFPAVIALIAGLLLQQVAVPTLVSNVIDALATLVVPLIMISVGISLRLGTLREHALTLGVLALLRLAVAPAVAWGVGSFVLKDPAALRLVVLEAGVPSMMLTLVIGARFRLDTDFIASAILVTTVASIATIPLWQILVS